MKTKQSRLNINELFSGRRIWLADNKMGVVELKINNVVKFKSLVYKHLINTELTDELRQQGYCTSDPNPSVIEMMRHHGHELDSRISKREVESITYLDCEIDNGRAQLYLPTHWEGMGFRFFSKKKHAKAYLSITHTNDCGVGDSIQYIEDC